MMPIHATSQGKVISSFSRHGFTFDVLQENRHVPVFHVNEHETQRPIIQYADTPRKAMNKAYKVLDEKGREGIYSAIAAYLAARKAKRATERIDRYNRRINAVLSARNGFSAYKGFGGHNPKLDDIKRYAIKLNNGKTVYPLYVEVRRLERERIAALKELNPATKYMESCNRYWAKQRKALKGGI